MRIKGRKEGGEKEDSYLSFLEKFWERGLQGRDFYWRF